MSLAIHALDTLSYISAGAGDTANTVTVPGSGTINDETTSNLLTSVRSFIGPIFLLIVAAVSLTFIFKRQTTQLFQFLAIAVVVGVLFYSTDIIPAIGDYVSGWIGQGGDGTQT